MSLITVRDLTLGYDGQKIASGINFTVDASDYLCIVGENGSGKTTLMKTLLRLQEPMGGEIVLGDGLKRTEIGYLPQQTMIQRDFPASVREIVLSGCQNRAGFFYSAADKALADQNMRRMGVFELKNRCYRALSGGQQQRVLLARALCATRKVLLLDEPVTGLDPRVTAELYELIRGLNEEGVTIIMISHDVGAAVKDCSHVLHIGKTVFFGTRDQYAQSELGRRFLAQEGGADA